MEEQLPFLQVAVSISESVFIAILLLLLMVFLSVFCLRCQKSKTEDCELLLANEESTPEDVTHSWSKNNPENTSDITGTYGKLPAPRSTTDIMQPQRVEESTLKQDDAGILPISTNGVAQKSAIPPTVQQAETTVEDQQQEQITEVQPATEQPQASTDAKPTDTEWLSTNNLREVINAVFLAREKWRLIGIQLGIQIVNLNVIGYNRHDNPDECIVDMIHTWLNQEGATWRELISALKHETVGCAHTASLIAAEQPQASTVEIPCSSAAVISRVTTLGNVSENNPLSSDLPSSTVSSFGNLNTSKLNDKESRRLKARLRQDTRKIITHFSDLVVHMRRSFKQRNFDPQDLATTVKGIAKREPGTHSLQESMNLSAVTSIDVLVDQLQNENYISFINYHLVEYMISQYGSEEDKRKFADYEIEFKEYCKRSVFEVPQDVFGCVPSDGVKFTFKVTKEVVKNLPSNHTQVEDDEDAIDNPTVEASSKNLKLSLGDVMFIQEKVSETLDLDVGSFVLLGASRGCVELTFSVPKVIVKKVKTQLEEVSGPVYSNLEAKGIHILCGPPGKPQVTKGLIRYCLQWTKPSYQGFHTIRHYKISYRSVHDRTKVWKTFETEDPMESIVIPNEIIHHNSSLVFKVQPVTDIGCGVDSEESDPVTLRPLSTRVIQCYDARSYYNAQKSIPLTGGKH